MSYLYTVESERCGRVFPLATPTKCLRAPYLAQGKGREFVGKQTDLIVISNLHQLISNKPAGINPILLSPAQQERCEDVKV